MHSPWYYGTIYLLRDHSFSFYETDFVDVVILVCKLTEEKERKLKKKSQQPNHQPNEHEKKTTKEMKDVLSSSTTQKLHGKVTAQNILSEPW